jgi:S-formylglutathione hydrolase FrmB
MKSFYLIFLTFISYSIVVGQNGKVIDELIINSKILKGDRKFAVYLPPDYDSSNRSYPVLYLLHGLGDNQSAWIQFGEVLHTTDKAINSGIATSMIIIMPDAGTGQMGYTNAISGKWNYEDFFFEEFIPHVENLYRIRKNKRYRAISGLSMGGGGSFLYALRRPDLFSSAAPLSASIGPQNIEQMDDYSYLAYWGYSKSNINKSDFEKFKKKNNSLYLIDQMDQKILNSVRWYIDCGDEDHLYKNNVLMHIKMREKGVKHEFRVRDGGHNWDYWRSALPSVLEFISKKFH